MFIYKTLNLNANEYNDDGLGQTYQTPDSAIKAGSDIIIVGRGIYQAGNPKQAASKYRKVGCSSYVSSLYS